MARDCAPEAVLLNPRELDPVAAIKAATGGRGVDVALDYTGSAEAIRQALAVLKARGRVILVGVPAGTVELNIHHDVILKEARVLGISGRLLWDTWWQMREMLDKGMIDPLKVITHRFPLEEFERAFALAAGGETGKVLLYP